MSTNESDQPKTIDRSDLLAFLAFLAITTTAVGFRFYYDNWLSDFDIFTFFLPAFGYVGDRLRDFDIPAWNPYFSSGQPMAGDPGGGWLYLPAMIGFTLFVNAASGMKAMVLIQLLVAGSATYLFARRIGFVPIAALISTLSISIGPILYGSTSYVTIIGQTTPFVALSMLGIECAIRSHRRIGQIAWGGLAGVALSQIFLAWPQGFMYTVMLLGGWMLYRWRFALLPEVGTRQDHLERILVSGLAMSASMATFGAAGILPRLSFSAESNIPGGDYSQVVGADYAAAVWPVQQVVGLYFQNTIQWRPLELNATIIILALAALFMGRNRFGIPLFAIATAIFIDISVQHSLTRWLFYLIPGFEQIHSHRPTASVSLVYFPVAVMAGAGVQIILENRSQSRAMLRRILPLAVVLVTILLVGMAGWPTSYLQATIAAIATGLIVLPLIRLPVQWRPHLFKVTLTGLFALLLIFPNAMDIVSTIRDPGTYPEMNDDHHDSFGRDDIVQDVIATSLARKDPGTAAEFLQQRKRVETPFRYAPYFGTGSPDSPYVASSSYRLRPWAAGILTGARAPFLELEQIGGYNPIHLLYYTEYMAVMNGELQDYHWLDVYMAALEQSPLFNMLNVRYVLVPAKTDKPVPIAAWGKEVYRDDLVVVYENPQAFERAWIVHDVRQAMDGDELDLLNAGTVDAAQVAYVDGPIPAAAALPSGSTDTVAIVETAPESMTIQTHSAADGLLVIGDAYADGWTAWVDGDKTGVLRTNHALRGVALPAGDHEVIVRYEPASLRIGLWGTALTSIGLIGIWSWAIVDWRRSRPWTE